MELNFLIGDDEDEATHNINSNSLTKMKLDKLIEANKKEENQAGVA